MVRGRTNDEGWADFPALSFPGATVLVESSSCGRRRVGWRGGEKELKLELVPEAVLSGEVTAAGRKPMETFYVSVRSGAGDEIFTEVRPDEKGRFRISEMPAGVWTVTIRAEDRELKPYEEVVTLGPGDSKAMAVVLQKQRRAKGEL
jgi:hypothetical protein